MDYNYFMGEAYKNALRARLLNEVPIGCVIALGQEIIASGFNMRNSKKNPLFHAEIIAIDKACRITGDWRLEECTLFVTVEPCPMCAGAILQARIKEVVFATRNSKAGCAGSVMDILSENGFNHKVVVTEGIMRDECAELMSSFFKHFRTQQTKKNSLN